MDKKINSRVLRMAQDAGYDAVYHIGKWKGYDVFEPFFNDDLVRFLGYPQYILVRDGKLRWTKDSEESLAIMNLY